MEGFSGGNDINTSRTIQTKELAARGKKIREKIYITNDTAYYSMRKSNVVKFSLNSCTTDVAVGGPLFFSCSAATRVGGANKGGGSV